ncbi:MAG TPA: bi-domain-containing oxidoreductase, partial [Bacteroidia bacterium]|nr:bi-domain-containing oxidoreductase [Bacteroidia bacterium]
LIQDIKSGKTILQEVPMPQVQRGQILVRTHRTLVSSGTERMLVEFGKANLISKALQQPERVKQVFAKMKTDGIVPAVESVLRKLDEPLPLGYCNSGEVIAVGDDVTEFSVGDKVATNGYHAEVVCVPKNLAAKIPDNVSHDEACFAVIGAVALQGMRLLKPTFGETFVVIGLGLVGQMTAQLLSANGCRVIGFDVNDLRVELAASLKITAYNSSGSEAVSLVKKLTDESGADGVIITASSSDDEIISGSAHMCRKRGRIVLTGVTGLHLNRNDFYEKEISFRVSSSYGPGRYDDEYEIKGNDYPLPFVRWTAKRNFESVLEAMSSGKLNVKALISEIVSLDDYGRIYDNISRSGSLASILKYDISKQHSSIIRIFPREKKKGSEVIAIIGAGNFAKGKLLPELARLDANVKYVSSESGLSASLLAKKFKVKFAVSGFEKILSDDEVNSVFIMTPHHLHAEQIAAALQAGKNVFAEKPLAINHEQLEMVIRAYEKSESAVMVGFNRRFSPYSVKAKEFLKNSTMIQVIATMNAGKIPYDDLLHDLNYGGGRIVGEACHYIDLISFFTGSKVASVMMAASEQETKLNTDIASLFLKYENGSLGVLNYFSTGHNSFPKEKVEIFSDGSTMVINNFRSLKTYGFKNSGISGSQDKGHREQYNKYLNFLRHGGSPPVSFEEIINTTKASLAAIDSLRERKWIDID